MTGVWIERSVKRFISRKRHGAKFTVIIGRGFMGNFKQLMRLIYVAALLFVGASMLSGCIVAPPYGGYYGGHYGERGDGWHHGEDR